MLVGGGEAAGQRRGSGRGSVLTPPGRVSPGGFGLLTGHSALSQHHTHCEGPLDGGGGSSAAILCLLLLHVPEESLDHVDNITLTTCHWHSSRLFLFRQIFFF